MPRLLRWQTLRARALRRAATPAEQALWALLRGGRLGVKFRRQQPMGPFVLDFFCYEAGLAVEVDGDSHRGRADRDRKRDQWVLAHGFRVLRLTNQEVMVTPRRAVERIRAAL